MGLRTRLGKRKPEEGVVVKHSGLPAETRGQPAALLRNATSTPPSTALSNSMPLPTPSTPANVFNRLQALFPTPAPPKSARTAQSRSTNPSPPKPPRSMKIKIISWNMHDSIPGGDLEQLLGPIPPHIPSSFDLPPNDCNLPDLGDDDLHPYHLVVVAGQECPSLSGIPMAIGAGYRLGHHKDKEKHKEREKERRSAEHGRKNEPEGDGSQSNALPMDRDTHFRSPSVDLAKSPPLPAQSPGPTECDQRSVDTPDSEPQSSLNPFASNMGDVFAQHKSLHHHPGGWSAILEDWLVHGTKFQRKHQKMPAGRAPHQKSANGSAPSVALSQLKDSHDGLKPSTLLSGLITPPLSPTFPGDHALNRASSDGHYHARLYGSSSPQLNLHHMVLGSMLPEASSLRPITNVKRSESMTAIPDSSSMPCVTGVRNGEDQAAAYAGPYELAAKERMMGIYLAVYVHRDAKSLIRGIDKDSVTAGLIGGRMGNKGGVGISLNLDGTTLLFINAHLAAHQAKTVARLENLSKIKSELTLDAFRVPQDSRNLAEDITDRYDYSFIFGDLNFRVDLPRCDVDELILRKDYAQALKFDQLRRIMAEGDLPDFHEASIEFPPTFKYDVASSYSRQSDASAHERPGLGKRRRTLQRAMRKLKREKEAVMQDLANWRNIGRSTEALCEDGVVFHCEETADNCSIASSASGTPALESAASGQSCTEAEDESSLSSDDDDENNEAHHDSSVARMNALRNARSPLTTTQGQIDQHLDNIGTVVSEAITIVAELPATKKAKLTLRSFLEAARRGVLVPRSSASNVSSRRKHSSMPLPSETRPANGSADPQVFTPSPHNLAESSSPDLQPVQVLPSIAINTPTDGTPVMSNTNLPLGVGDGEVSASSPPTPQQSLVAGPPMRRRPSASGSSAPQHTVSEDPTAGTFLHTSPNSHSSRSSGRDRKGRRKHEKSTAGSAHLADIDGEFEEPVSRPGVYDSSSKQRVPSWCDRILYKSTVVPPEEDEPEYGSPDQQASGSRPRVGVGQLLNHWFYRHRLNSIDTVSTTTAGSKTSRPPRQTSNENGLLFPRTLSLSTDIESPEKEASYPYQPQRRPRFGMLMTRGSTMMEEGTSSAPTSSTRRGPSRSFSLPPKDRLIGWPPASSESPSPADVAEAADPVSLRMRSSSTSSMVTGPSSMPNCPLSHPPVPSPSSSPSNEAPAMDAAPSSPLSATTARVTPSKRWFAIALSLPTARYPSSPPPTSLDAAQSSAQKATPKQRRRPKGDVQCLSYRTLDDESMAKLRGKSDHRPIIGVYSICVA